MTATIGGPGLSLFALTLQGYWPDLHSPATPYFNFNAGVATASMDRFGRAFPGSEVCYALKANPHPALLQEVAAAGGGFEAAGWGEIALLLDLGIPAQRILFGTAVKSRQAIAAAFQVGVDRFAADSVEELAKLGQAAPGCRVLIRAVGDDAASVFHLSDKFGAPLADVPRLVREALHFGLTPEGLSFNVGSQAGRAAQWGNSLRGLRKVLDEVRGLLPEVPTIDIGGGFPVAYGVGQLVTPTLEEIAVVVDKEIRRIPGRVQIMLEPGRAIAAGTFDLVTTVIARVERPSGMWLYTDAGVYNALFEALACQGSTRYPLRCLTLPQAEHLERFIIAGPTGDSLDVITRDGWLPAAAGEGDVLSFGLAGAYSHVLASGFNGCGLPTVLHGEPT